MGFVKTLIQENKNKITGILLAGGMSKRMGREKGLLPIGNAFLYQYPLQVLNKLCDEVLISTCSTSFMETGHQTVCDEVKDIGPLGGIYSCLNQSSNDLNLVLSYDMPIVSEALFTALLAEQEDYNLVLPALNDKYPEPLCGIYSKKLTDQLKALIEAEDYAVRHLRSKCRSKVVAITRKMPCWHPDLFLNINSREDLHKLPPGFGEEA